MKRLTLLAIALSSMASTKSLAYDLKSENEDGVTISYNIINGGSELEVIGCSSCQTLNIPASVTHSGVTRQVTSIAERAFYENSRLTSVSIPDGVTSIGEEAFYGCGKLTSVAVPNSVTSIGDAAFQWCTRLTSLSIPENITRIENHTFCQCVRLKSVEIPTGVVTIGNSAFSGCSGLSSLNIANSVTTIGDFAFADCSGLTTLTIPNSVVSIGECCFFKCSGISSLIIPNSVTNIGNSAFLSCSDLISLTIGSSVKSIGHKAFDCDNISTVISLIENPFVISANFQQNQNTFSSKTFSTGVLYVPYGTKDMYKMTEGWNRFTNIEELEPINTGISPVHMPTTNSSFYTLDGKHITQPSKGINIIRMSDGTTKKVLVK